jgi:hypothetical protein
MQTMLKKPDKARIESIESELLVQLMPILFCLSCDEKYGHEINSFVAEQFEQFHQGRKHLIEHTPECASPQVHTATPLLPMKYVLQAVHFLAVGLTTF